ncbi:hypothetical protein Q3G72_028540 [Acer saccharum]|nr:hypothetical protein Q3G72_028540 [Acer saccharum]
MSSGPVKIVISSPNYSKRVFSLHDIFSAESDTSATTIEWAMSELLKDPRVMEKAQAEVRQAFRGKSKIEEADIQKLNYLKSIVKKA